MDNIYLVGFMGTGKTCAGKELAARTGRQFADLDDLIELKVKRPIADIFAKDGEPYFRKIEKKVLKEAAGQKDFVFACGGGIVIDPENIKIMKQTGRLICLAATPEVILKRTSGFGHRPLLNVKDPKKQIEHLLKLRAPYYAQADKTIDTSKLSIKQVAEMILKAIKPSRVKKGFMFIELLLVLAVIMFITYQIFRLYFNGPAFNKETQSVISEQGADAANPRSVIDVTRNKLTDIQNRYKSE